MFFCFSNIFKLYTSMAGSIVYNFAEDEERAKFDYNNSDSYQNSCGMEKIKI